jgi:hypothetical protein
MTKRIKFHIIHNSDNSNWQLKKENSQRAISNHTTKEEAIEKGRELAKGIQPSQLLIHKKDNTIQTEHTYRNDPYPPKG